MQVIVSNLSVTGSALYGGDTAGWALDTQAIYQAVSIFAGELQMPMFLSGTEICLGSPDQTSGST